MSHRYRFRFILFLAVLASAALFPSLLVPAAETGGTSTGSYSVKAYVADPDPKGINVRSGPGPGYPVIATCHYGDIVSIDRCEGEWVHTDYARIIGDDYNKIDLAGWIYGPLLAVVATINEIYPDPSGLVPIRGEIRDSEIASCVAVWVHPNTELRVIGCYHGLVKVRYKEVEGWITRNDYDVYIRRTPPGAAETAGIRTEPCEVKAYVADPDPKGINVRSGPGQNYPVVTTLPYREKVTISGSVGEWMHVCTIKWNKQHTASETSEPIGWVYGPLLAVMTSGESWRDEPSTGSTPIWEEMRIDAPIVAWAPTGIELRVIGCKSHDVKVRYKNVEGWLLYGSYSEVPPSAASPTGAGKTVEVVPCENVSAYVIDKDPKGANVRSGPGSDYRSIVTLPTDRPVQVTIVGAVGDWVRIKNPVFFSKEREITMEITAWAHAPLFGVRTKNAEDPSGAVSLYTEPRAESQVVAEVPGDTEATILECRGGWLKVRCEGKEGWLAPGSSCGDPSNYCP